MMNNKRSRALTATGLAAALLCVLSPIAIPMGDVPLSLGTLVILVSAAVLGPWRSAAAVAVYLVLGCVGLPVFSGFTGGVGRILGPTGGFLVGYIVLAVIAGLGKGKIVPMVIGTLALYAIGTLWYTVYADVPPWTALTVCVMPCLPLDGVKIAVAAVVGKKIEKII